MDTIFRLAFHYTKNQAAVGFICEGAITLSPIGSCIHASAARQGPFCSYGGR